MVGAVAKLSAREAALAAAAKQDVDVAIHVPEDVPPGPFVPLPQLAQVCLELPCWVRQVKLWLISACRKIHKRAHTKRLVAMECTLTTIVHYHSLLTPYTHY